MKQNKKVIFPLPPFIKVLTEEFKITRKRDYGGHFEFKDRNILDIGYGYQVKRELFETWAHEISEIIHIIMGTRYSSTVTTGEFKFIMDHDQFALHNMILSEIIYKYRQYFEDNEPSEL